MGTEAPKRTEAPTVVQTEAPTEAPKVTYEGTITVNAFKGDGFPENTFPPAYPITGSWTSTPAGNGNSISLANCDGVDFGGEIPPLHLFKAPCTYLGRRLVDNIFDMHLEFSRQGEMYIGLDCSLHVEYATNSLSFGVLRNIDNTFCMMR